MWDTGGDRGCANHRARGPWELVTLPGVTRSTGSHQPGASGCGCNGLLCSTLLLVQCLLSTNRKLKAEEEAAYQDLSRAGPGTGSLTPPGLILPLPAQLHKCAESCAARAQQLDPATLAGAAGQTGELQWNFPGGKAARWIRPSYTGLRCMD